MKKILLLSHIYHANTKSCHFFLSALRNIYKVEIVYLNPESQSECVEKLSQVRIEFFDAVVLWQLDYFAAYYLRRGIPTIVCPMVDASLNLSFLHWRAMQGALIVCFSYAIYQKAIEHNIKAVYVKFWPTVKKTTVTTEKLEEIHDKEMHAFYWERRPDSSTNTLSVIRFLENTPVRHLHIHQAPDPGLSPTPIPKNSHLAITTSSWFNDKSEYLSMVSRSHLYIAPRLYEGIGMSFLEAMGMNCCVVAPDNPTYSEYIMNGLNGILIDFSKPQKFKVSPEEVIALCRAAGSSSNIGIQSWNNMYSPMLMNEIHDYISAYSPNSTSVPSEDLFLARMANASSDFFELSCLSSAHTNLDLYYWHLKRTHSLVSGTKSSLATSNISKIYGLIGDNEHEEALSLLKELADSSPPQVTVYKTIYYQLLHRLKRL